MSKLETHITPSPVVENLLEVDIYLDGEWLDSYGISKKDVDVIPEMTRLAYANR